MHRGATSEVETSELEDPARGIPGPAGDRIIDNRGPDEDEDYACEHAAAVGSGSDGEGRARKSLLAGCKMEEEKNVRDSCEHALVESVQQIRDLWTAHTWLCKDIVEAKIREVANEGARGVRECKRIAP